jgi:hypothetical protein
MKKPATPKKPDPKLQAPSGELLALIQNAYNQLTKDLRKLGGGLLSEVDLTVTFKCQAGVHHYLPLLAESTIGRRKKKAPDEKLLAAVQRQGMAFCDCLMEFGEEKIERIYLLARYTNGNAFTYEKCVPEEVVALEDDEDD